MITLRKTRFLVLVAATSALSLAHAEDAESRSANSGAALYAQSETTTQSDKAANPSAAETSTDASGSSGTSSSSKAENDAGAERGVSQLVDRPSTSGAGTVKTATSGAPGINNLPGAENQPQSSGASNVDPPVMPQGTSGGPGVEGAPHVGIPGTGKTDESGGEKTWGEKVIEK